MCADLERIPRTLLVSERSSFQNQKNQLSAHVGQHHFNYKVSVLLPECGSAPPLLDAALNGFSSFYLIRNLPVYMLLDQDFLQTAVHQGSVYGLSFGCRVDEDPCVALMPNGRLVLSLDKDSFELLGFERKKYRFTKRATSRYVVSVNFSDSSMTPGGRGYQRLLTGLKTHLPLVVDFLVSHHPGGTTALQPLLSRYDWSEHRPSVSTRCLANLPCPLLTSDLQSCDPHSVLDWLGAVDADVSCENSSSSFLSTMVCPEPKTTASSALNMSVSGFLNPHEIHHLIQELRSYLDQSQLASWVALTVHGFTDSPVSWAGDERSVLWSGNTFYSLLLFKDDTYQLHLATGAHHTCPP
ncbi:ribonuclease P protein subunit p40-like [Sphaeramia orbicularis]|uniref:Ribonuclease P protein subunit p40-like n=1 Tax=Sphaeramia orbicularis TaxID=375764 RepID=A0A673AL04_9TELE|nr:ribonuclease P protein subunit p40-like [Sphaeramia orbicularis]XP_030016296.1 ribonuclease P protein subunit p40-like [Sphaeramia orbicularis]